MPEVISVPEFVAETNEDYQAPTTSSFSTRMSHCRNAVAALEEVRPRAIATGIDTSQEEVVAGRTVSTTSTKNHLSACLRSETSRNVLCLKEEPERNFLILGPWSFQHNSQ